MAVTVKMNQERPTIRLGRDPGMFGCVDIHFDDLSEATAALDILKRPLNVTDARSTGHPLHGQSNRSFVQ